MVGLHEKSIYRYIYIYVYTTSCMPQVSTHIPDTTCVPCVFTRRNRWQVWVSASIWSKSNARMYHLSQGHDPPAGFCHGFFFGDLGDLQYENHRWWVVNWYHKSDVSRHSDVSFVVQLHSTENSRTWTFAQSELWILHCVSLWVLISFLNNTIFQWLNTCR